MSASKKRKIEIQNEFIKTIEEISTQLINSGDEADNPLDQVRMVCDYLEHEFNSQKEKPKKSGSHK